MARIPTFVVNLLEDHDRLERLTSQLNPKYFELRERIGFLGRTLPDGVCLRLTQDENSLNNKGALGVMMSHILIWERVAHLKDAFALVLEDDIILDGPERLASAAPPSGFDVIFCGDQTADDPLFGVTRWLSYVPLIDTLPIMEHRKVSIGAYGYLLSPRGAQRLLALFTEHLYFSHVDVRMLAYCCDLNELSNVQSPGRLNEELCVIRRIIEDKPKLAGYATVQTLVRHIGMDSRREREDAMGQTGIVDHADA